jgi:hypothetical protein
VGGAEVAKRAGIPLAILAAAAIAAALLLRDAGETSSEDEALLEQLQSLGYVEQVSSDPDPDRSGVILHDPERAYPGINVYCSVRSREVRFLDMDGRLLHTISLPESGEGSDCLLVPTGEGDFLALSQPLLVRIGWDSEVRWVSRRAHHHDVALDGMGRIYTLTEKPGFLSDRRGQIPIRDHAILVLDADGKAVREIEISPLLGGAVSRERIAWMRRLLSRGEPRAWPYELVSDVYHPNAVQVLDREVGPGRPGQLLLCLRELDLLVIVDPDRESVVWRWGARSLDHPHHPTVLPNGNLLVFDNGWRRKWSRVIEVVPATGEVAWRYQGDPRESFFSDVRGSAQALPNGNVLITESTKGRVFEVTRRGELVWEFWNPDRTDDGVRRQIYRMQRLRPDRLGRSADLGPRGRAGGPHPIDVVAPD